jgi:RibD C-terminal domain
VRSADKASSFNGLRELYDGGLHFRTSPAERPFVIGNFVSTLDGVVSYAIKGQAGGSTISGSDCADRFIMGLLRASADAIMVGAGTVHEGVFRSPKALRAYYPVASICTRNTGQTHCINQNTPSS